MSRRKYKKAAARRESGGFVPLPHVVLRSESFAGLSSHASKLVFDLFAQFNGSNNGDLCAAWSCMRKRGWKSQDTLDKAKKELLGKEFIIVSRQGGRHKATLYAFTFFAIDECKGKLDIASTHTPTSQWRRHEPSKAPPKINPVQRVP